MTARYTELYFRVSEWICFEQNVLVKILSRARDGAIGGEAISRGGGTRGIRGGGGRVGPAMGGRGC